LIRVLLADKLTPKVVDSLKEIPDFEGQERVGLDVISILKDFYNV